MSLKIEFRLYKEKDYLFYNTSLKACIRDELEPLNIPGRLVLYYLTPLINCTYMKHHITGKSNLKLQYKNQIIGRYYARDRNAPTKIMERSDFEPLIKDEQYEYFLKLVNKKNIIYHQKKGVYFLDSQSVFIAPHVGIGRNTYIYPSVFIGARCKIGENNRIGPHTSLENFCCGCYNEINHVVAFNSTIGNYNRLGPFCHLRDKVILGDRNIIGNFTELKSVQVQDDNKMKHLSYLGDSEVGNMVNIGCGVITANYSGTIKSKTKIGDGAFIGCNSVLVAPVSIGDKAFIAANSTITENVDDEDFAIARSRQITKKQYMKK